LLNDEKRVRSLFNDGRQLRNLLTATKGETAFQTVQLPVNVQDPTFLHALESAHLLKKDRNLWIFPAYAKVQVAIRALQLGEPNRPVLTALTWQEFEEFVAHVLAFHNFQVFHRFRFSTSRRFEIDIVGSREPVLFCIDCKQYGVRLGKATALRTASEAQLQRTEALAEHIAQFQAELGCLEWQQITLIPIVVTMLIEDIQFHDRIPIVPASFFNAFLLGYEEKFDILRIVRPSSSRQKRLI
jgi:Holliday junction resolvase-like predicted endonuclease